MLLHRHRLPLLCCSTRGAAVLNGADKGAVRQLTWAQVEAMTGNFTSAVVGEGGSSTVYLARLPHGELAAVKVHRRSQRLRRAFRHELHALLRARHPHIVRLLAFCDQTDEGVLVLELAPNGSLHDHLHGLNPQGELLSPVPVPMPWARRVRVALQVGRALEYLHEACEPQLVHGDVKASNVLLDAAMDARLCDFGSSHAGFSAAVRPATTAPRGGVMVGSPGYVDPQYLRSGLVTKKSDVYSLGVLLLELLTGAPPFRADDGRLLTSIVAPVIQSRWPGVCDVRKLVDKRLGCHYDADEAAVVAGLAAACVGDNPALRPSMADLVHTLEKISAVGTGEDRTAEANRDT